MFSVFEVWYFGVHSKTNRYVTQLHCIGAESIYYACWAFYETTQFWAVPPKYTLQHVGLAARPQKPQKGFDLLQKIALDAFTILLGIYFLHEVAFGNKKCVFSYANKKEPAEEKTDDTQEKVCVKKKTEFTYLLYLSLCFFIWFFF